MDFPLQLIPTTALNTPTGAPHGSNLEFVYGEQELRNHLYLLLKTISGRFLQDVSLGTLAVPHMVEDVFLESMIRRCCEQIPGLQCKTVDLRDGTFYVQVVYRGEIQEYSFSVTSL